MGVPTSSPTAPGFSPTPMFDASGAPVDPSTLIPVPRHIAPPTSPGYLGASTTPGSQQQVPITTGYDTPPSLIDSMRLNSAVQQAKATAPAAPAPPPAVAPPAATPTAPSAPPAPEAPPSAVTDLLGQHDPAFDAFWQHMLPGESGGKNVPNEKYRPGVTASGPAQITDTNWLQIAPKLGIDIRRFPTAMSAPPDYQKAVTKLMYRMYGSAPWDVAHGGALPVGFDAELQPRIDAARAGYETKAANASKNLQDALAQIKSDRVLDEKGWARIREARDTADKAQADALRSVREQPKAPTLDGVQHLTSIGVIVGLLGGLMTKAPMLASTNAAAAALEAYNAGDLRAYNIAHAQWKDNTDYMFQIAGMQADRVRELASDEKMSMDERRARVDAQLRIMGLQQVADDARINGLQSAIDWSLEIRRLDQERERLQRERDKTEYMYNQADKQWYRIHPITGAPPEPMGSLVPQSAAVAAGRRDQISPEAKTRADARYQAWLADPQNAAKSPQEKQEQLWTFEDEAQRQVSSAKRATSGAAADENAYTDAYVAEKIASLGHTPTPGEIARLKIEGRAEAKNTMRGIGIISDEAANLMAQQMILGDTQVLTSLPRSGPSRIKVENKFAELLREQGDDAARAVVMNRLRMLEAQAAARTAGRVTMQTEIFAKEATDAGAEVVRTSKLVPRTDQPMFNRALEAFYRQEGDPNIIAFGAALSAFVNAYGKMSNPTGTGVHDADKERIQQAIDASLSQGQIEAGVQQVITEGTIISNAARTAQQQVLQGLAPTGIGPSTAAPPAAPRAAAPPAGGPPHVTTQADYDALPPNTDYIGPDGQKYTKGR